MGEKKSFGGLPAGLLATTVLLRDTVLSLYFSSSSFFFFFFSPLDEIRFPILLYNSVDSPDKGIAHLNAPPSGSSWARREMALSIRPQGKRGKALAVLVTRGS